MSAEATGEPLWMDDLPPTEYLILEVLAARWRVGERVWTFPTRVNRALDSLAGKGLVGWKSGVVERTSLAWLTDGGRAEMLSDTYETPTVAEAVAAADARWINLLSAGAQLNRGEIDLAEFRRRTRRDEAPA